VVLKALGFHQKEIPMSRTDGIVPPLSSNPLVPQNDPDAISYNEEVVIELLSNIMFSRCAMTVWLIFASCLMAGVPWWKTIIVCLTMAYLYQSGFGIRWLEKLAFVVTICAAVYFVDVVQFDKIGMRALELWAAI
jgi:hypothetical protein